MDIMIIQSQQKSKPFLNKLGKSSRSKKSKNDSMFDQNKFFNENDTLTKMYKTSFSLVELNRSLLNKVDFMKVNDRAFESFMEESPYLSEITTKSFMKKLISWIKQKYTKQKHYMISPSWLDKMTQGKFSKSYWPII